MKTQLIRELEEILNNIPHDDLAIQWGHCRRIWDFGRRISNVFYPIRLIQSLKRLIRLGDKIPGAVELGLPSLLR